MRQGSLHRAWQAPVPPPCCSTRAPACGLRSRCAANGAASRALDDGFRLLPRPAAAAAANGHRGHAPAAASREASVLEAVGISQDWRTEEQTLTTEQHRPIAHTNGSAEPSSHTVASPPEVQPARAEAPHDGTASSAGTSEGEDAGVQPFQGLGEVRGMEDAAVLSRAADVAASAMEGSSIGTDEGAVEASAADGEVFQGLGELAEIEELLGVRVSVDGNGKAIVEYLVRWKDEAPDTWEVKDNVAENVLRDYEDRWWTACREGDEETVKAMLQGGRRVLVHAINSDQRSALHFAAAIGNVKITQMLCQAGADVDLGDKDGYTPLHMAAGYLHVPAVVALLQGGANPEVKDRKGQSVLDLVDSLKAPMAGDPSRRLALEKVSEILVDTLYDELEPQQILDVRDAADGGREFLVQWPDDMPDSWVHQRFMADDIVEDFDAGLEYAEAEAVLRIVQRGDQRQCLVRWADGEPDSWVDEECVAPGLVDEWLQEHGQQAVLLNPRRKQRRAKQRWKPTAAQGQVASRELQTFA